MTVIAWDGRTLAADRRSTTGDGAISVVTKIHRVRGMLVGTTGDQSVGRELLAWFEAAAVPSDFPASARDDKATLVTIRPTGVIEHYTTGPQPCRFEVARMAWGCGRDFARAAMECGRSAREAVALTCELNAFCGNGVDSLEFEA